MSTAKLKGYAMDVVFVLIALAVINTVKKRVPVVGNVVDTIERGL